MRLSLIAIKLAMSSGDSATSGTLEVLAHAARSDAEGNILDRWMCVFIWKLIAVLPALSGLFRAGTPHLDLTDLKPSTFGVDVDVDRKCIRP